MKGVSPLFHALIAVVALPSAAAAQLMLPPGWKWATDVPARVTTDAAFDQVLGDSVWRFTQMTPGWHVTTRPAAIMYDGSIQASGRYIIESLQILFPGESQSGYGLFVGGHDLDGSAASYVAFLTRRDGQVAVERRQAGRTTSLVNWTPSPAVKLAAKSSETVSNTLRVIVEADSVRFSVNAQPVIAVARRELPVDGYFGFRTGPDINMHITTLDFTRRIATVPAPKQ